jgi:hypothetical protein
MRIHHLVATFAAVAGLWLVTAAPASAQPSFDITIGRWFESTTSVVSDPDQTRTIAAQISAEHQMDDERLRLFYDLDAGDFSTAGAWNYFLHHAGATYRVDFAEGRHKLFVGGNATVRSNGASWSDANFGGIQGLANLQLTLRPGATLRTGYRLDARRFPDLPDLNQLEHSGFASLLVNLPSRTTIIGEVQTGAKRYDGEVVFVDAPALLDPSGSAGTRGRGLGRGLGLMSSVPSASQVEDHASQVTWLARVAQSIVDRLGVSAQFSQRRSFGTVPPGVVETPPGFFEDGVYDDPYASDLDALSLTAKYAFARGDAVEAWSAWMRKDYRATLALGPEGWPLAGEPLRSDRVTRAGAGWTIPVFPAKTGATAIDVIAGYVFTRSRSNDAFYDYTSHMLGVSLAVSF